MNILTILSQLNAAQKAGETIINPATWANRATAAGAVSAMLATGGALASNFLGQDVWQYLGVTPDGLQNISLGVVVVGGAVSNYLHKASNPNAGK